MAARGCCSSRRQAPPPTRCAPWGWTRCCPFPSEHAAEAALRGAAPHEAPGDWKAAVAESLEHWRGVRTALDTEPDGTVLRQVTAMHGLCHRAEEEFQLGHETQNARCYFCPLFHALGGHPQDIGCRSVQDPLFADLAAGDRETARKRVNRIVELLEQLAASTR